MPVRPKGFGRTGFEGFGGGLFFLPLGDKSDGPLEFARCFSN